MFPSFRLPTRRATMLLDFPNHVNGVVHALRHHARGVDLSLSGGSITNFTTPWENLPRYWRSLPRGVFTSTVAVPRAVPLAPLWKPCLVRCWCAGVTQKPRKIKRVSKDPARILLLAGNLAHLSCVLATSRSFRLERSPTLQLVHVLQQPLVLTSHSQDVHTKHSCLLVLPSPSRPGGRRGREHPQHRRGVRGEPAGILEKVGSVGGGRRQVGRGRKGNPDLPCTR